MHQPIQQQMAVGAEQTDHNNIPQEHETGTESQRSR